MKKKLAVFFPGRRYGVDCPLLYYAESICREKGYDTLLMHYSEYRDKKTWSPSKRISDRRFLMCVGGSKKKILLRTMRFLFVYKKSGNGISRMACRCTRKKEKRVKPGTVRHIFMTPLEQTFPYMRKENCIVISGELDHYLERKKLKKFCKKHKVRWYCFPDVGHSMEHEKIKIPWKPWRRSWRS